MDMGRSSDGPVRGSPAGFAGAGPPGLADPSVPARWAHAGLPYAHRVLDAGAPGAELDLDALLAAVRAVPERAGRTRVLAVDADEAEGATVEVTVKVDEKQLPRLRPRQQALL